MKLYIGADHAGFPLKEKLKSYLIKSKYKVTDLGNKEYNKTDDYPVYAAKVAKKVAKEKNSFGIIVCGSGQGVCIAANKIRGIRAAVAEHIKDAYLARNDDDCNVLCLPGRVLNLKKAGAISTKFLETKFDNGEKRVRRVNEIKRLEQ